MHIYQFNLYNIFLEQNNHIRKKKKTSTWLAPMKSCIKDIIPCLKCETYTYGSQETIIPPLIFKMPNMMKNTHTLYIWFTGRAGE